MKKIEKAPNWRDIDQDEGIKLLMMNDFQLFIKKINDKYLFWDKIKYQKGPKDVDPKILWTAVKISRLINAKKLHFGRYNFSYNLTDYIQEELHEFDLNIGGQLGTKGVIPTDGKNGYLVSSIMEEAIASSQIEGAVTTRKKAKEMLRKNIRPKTKSEQMIVNNYKTIQYILSIKDESLTKESLFAIHRLITHQTLDDIKDEGRYRVNNDITVVDSVDGNIVHTPPTYDELPELMDELFSFFNEKEGGQFIHPIIKGCILHFLIGFIHPFVDGNGRTARALYYWYLLKNGYWLTEYLSISRLIVKSKTQYAMAFIYSEVDENDLSYFITYKLKTMKLAFKSLKEYIQRKISEKKQLVHFQKIVGVNSRQALILKWVDQEPDILLTTKEVETRLNISNQTARNDLKGLAEMGYLELIGMNKKSKAFCKSNLFDSLVKKALS